MSFGSFDIAILARLYKVPATHDIVPTFGAAEMVWSLADESEDEDDEDHDSQDTPIAEEMITAADVSSEHKSWQQGAQAIIDKVRQSNNSEKKKHLIY